MQATSNVSTAKTKEPSGGMGSYRDFKESHGTGEAQGQPEWYMSG